MNRSSRGETYGGRGCGKSEVGILVVVGCDDRLSVELFLVRSGRFRGRLDCVMGLLFAMCYGGLRVGGVAV
ncbi:hypothetical protein [Rubritalea tangerina]|uniref:hypothetical protein n=1 Tax=Rubritalea tangerina TaxID=430798 RepID=UPI0036190727